MNILEKIVEEIYPSFEGMDEYFLKNDKRSFATYCHSMLSGGIAMHIRNQFKLWGPDSENHKYFLEKGIEHPDDMSAEITMAVWEKFNNGVSK